MFAGEVFIRKSSKFLLLGLIAILILTLGAKVTPYILREGALYWAKRSAWKIVHQYPARTQLSLNALPTNLQLPSSQVPISSLEMINITSFTVHFPPPQSKELRNHSLQLTYPQFIVRFLTPYSTSEVDALYQKQEHQDLFAHMSQVNHVRPSDIDSQTDLPALSKVMLLITEKESFIARSTYFAEYAQHDRRGIIEAVDPDKQRVHAVIMFPLTSSACGMYFTHPKGVNPAEVQAFLSAIQINPTSTTTQALPVP